jgi:hypothetical protein
MIVFQCLSIYALPSMQIEVFSVLPINDLRNAKGKMSAPYELFYDTKPNLGSYIVFGCPMVAKKYTITHSDGRVAKNTNS